MTDRDLRIAVAPLALMSQTECARRLGLSVSTVSIIERLALRKLAKAVGVDVAPSKDAQISRRWSHAVRPIRRSRLDRVP